MDKPLTATVVRTWRGVAGRHWAHVFVEPGRVPTTIHGPEEFREGQRVEVTKIAHGYQLREGA